MEIKDMGIDNYKIIFEGKTQKGADLLEVKKALSAAFKTDISKIEYLFSGKRIVVKSDVNKQTAARYQNIFKNAGAVCKIVALVPSKKKRAPTPEKEPVKKSPQTQITTEYLLQQFKGKIEPIKVPFYYKITLIATSLTTILIPVLYLALVCLISYGLYFHAVENIPALNTARSVRLVVAVYLSPLIVGCVLLLFMIKPFFWRFFRPKSPIPLSRYREKRFYAFVQNICECVGAPTPERILIDCEVNASASFSGGLTGLLQNDLVLTIGLPLIEGMNTRQIASVLAHELGHFSQSAGMRLTYVIRSINFWLEHVVYSRDIWDHRLEEMTKSWGGLLSWVFHLARFFVWITRKILWVFMQIGILTTGYMLRQMEFDADRYGIHIAGSKTFSQTSHILTLLNVGKNSAQDILYTTWNDKQLADDFPRLIKNQADQLSDKAAEQIQKQEMSRATGLMDTHPCDKERNQRADKENTDGIFRLEIPASTLFNEYSKLKKVASFHHYKYRWGLDISQKNIIPVNTVLQQDYNLKESYQVLDNYLFGLFNQIRPLPIKNSPNIGPATLKDRIDEIVRLRKTIKVSAEKAPDLLKEFFTYYDQGFLALIAQGFIKTEIPITPEHFNLKAATSEAANTAFVNAMTNKGKSGRILYELDEQMAHRFHLVFSFFDDPEAVEKIKNAQKLKEEIPRLLNAYTPFSFSLERLEELKKAFYPIQAFTNLYEDYKDHSGYWDRLNFYEKECKKYIFELHYNLKNTAYPFDHSQGKISMSQFVLGDDLNMEDLDTVLFISERTIERMNHFHVRIMGRLSSIAQIIEDHIIPS